ncbi:MAG: ATP-dependent Clp protease adapter ClpS [Cyanobacteriota bacterium]
MSTELQEKINHKQSLMPKYKVLLHNDDHNSMDYVVECLVKTVNILSAQQAYNIMIEAHNTGIGLVATVHLELAEFYQECLQGYGLTATIEPE